MSDQDTAERSDQHSEHEGAEGAEGEESSDKTSESASGVVVEGYDTNNAPREQTQALLEADTPDDVDDDLIKAIEEERDRRLDPDNRPDNVEVDNTSRVFVPAEAKFEDSEIDQDPDLGQEGLAPVGGDAGDGGATDSDDSDDSEGSTDSDGSDGSEDADSSDHIEPDVESGDPKDESTTKTSGTPDPTDSDDEAGAGSGGGKHKA